MNGYMNEIRQHLTTLPTNTLIIANRLYTEMFSHIPMPTYYKSLERCVKSNELVHLTKGVYYKPKVTALGTIPISEQSIINHYIHDNQGIVIGYRMYNQKGLTTQVSKHVDILSTNIEERKKHLKNVTVQKFDITLLQDAIPTIETLEILQNYHTIEDASSKRLLAYMEKFAQLYSDDTVDDILKVRKYKKSTLASLQMFLNHLDTNNSLSKYLSPLSTYQTIEVVKSYETT